MKNLTTALRLNALFSLVTGLLLIFFSNHAAALFEVAINEPFWILGVGLLLFAGVVWFVSSRTSTNLVSVLVITGLDIGWVLGSTAIIGFQIFGLSAAGYWLIASVAFFVLGFAVHQGYALLYYDAVGSSPIRKQLSFSKPVRANRERAWAIISDVANYDTIAPNIDSVEIISGTGEGMVRACKSGDKTWSETCTHWEEGESYSFIVDTSPPDYPYPFNFLQGTWALDQKSDNGITIVMTFEFAYEKFYQAFLMHPLLSSWFRKVAGILLENWKYRIEKDQRETTTYSQM